MSVIEYKGCGSLMVVLMMRLICSAGTPFGLNNSAGLRPLNLLQVRLCSSEPLTLLADSMHLLLYLFDTPTHLLVLFMCLDTWNSDDELCVSAQLNSSPHIPPPLHCISYAVISYLQIVLDLIFHEW